MEPFTIYYSGDLCYTGSPEEAPTRGVQVIVQPDEKVGWSMQSGSDYYVWMEDRWVGVDIFGLWDYLASDGWKRVLFGRMATNEEYQAIYQTAKRERDRNKSAWLRGERRGSTVS